MGESEGGSGRGRERPRTPRVSYGPVNPSASGESGVTPKVKVWPGAKGATNSELSYEMPPGLGAWTAQ
jgi:hypothetical protein